MSRVGEWLTVSNVSDFFEVLVRIAALAAALIAANFFLFRADVSHVASVSDGVDRAYVSERYREAKEAVPDVVLATMADIEEGILPSRHVVQQSPLSVDEGFFCSAFVEHTRAVVGRRACSPGEGGLVSDMSHAQLLLLTNNDTSYLYRDPLSWVIRTNKPHPTTRSELFPEAIRSPAELKKDWRVLRAALVDRAVVVVKNDGRATAENVRITAPVGYRAVDEDEFEIPTNSSVGREFLALGSPGAESARGFTVTSKSGTAPGGWVVALIIVAGGLLLALAALVADVVRGPPPADS